MDVQSKWRLLTKTRGEDLLLNLEIEFKEAIFGGLKKIEFPHLEISSIKKIVEVTRSLEIVIPAGVDHGTKLRINNEGDASKNGGETGDLYIYLHVLSQNGEFKRCGMNIESEVKLTEEQAQIGCDVLIKMLEGEREISISAGTRDGDFLTLKGFGVPNLENTKEKGDHIIRFYVEPDFGDIWR